MAAPAVAHAKLEHCDTSSCPRPTATSARVVLAPPTRLESHVLTRRAAAARVRPLNFSTAVRTWAHLQMRDRTSQPSLLTAATRAGHLLRARRDELRTTLRALPPRPHMTAGSLGAEHRATGTAHSLTGREGRGAAKQQRSAATSTQGVGNSGHFLLQECGDSGPGEPESPSQP